MSQTVDEIPLLGDGDSPTTQFRLVVHGPEGRREELFTSYTEADAGSLLAMQRARTTQEQVIAAAGLISAALVDFDGLSAYYEPPEDEDADEDLDPFEDAPLDDETEHEPAVDPRLDDPEQWSSKRRFEHIINDPSQRVRPDALEHIVKILVGADAGRPTKKSASSSRGRRTTRRG